MVKKEIGKVENRLKCIGSHRTEIANAYKSFVDDRSREDFERLLNLRGIKKSEVVEFDKAYI